MIPFLAPLLLKLRALPWQWIGIGAAVLVVLWQLYAWGNRREAEGDAKGRAAVQVLWDADTAARDKAAAEAIAAAEAREKAAQERNRGIEADYLAKLAAVESDRADVERLLRGARGQVRALAASEATGQRGLDALAGIAARAAEVDRRLADYDAACRRDAVRLEALQEQIRPQM